jgi:hypothetical protein
MNTTDASSAQDSLASLVEPDRWKAVDWLVGVEHDVARDVAHHVRSGAPPAEAIADIADREVHAAATCVEPTVIDGQDAVDTVAAFYGYVVCDMLAEYHLDETIDPEDVLGSLSALARDARYVDIAMAALCLDDDAVSTAVTALRTSLT